MSATVLPWPVVARPIPGSRQLETVVPSGPAPSLPPSGADAGFHRLVAEQSLRRAASLSVAHLGFETVAQIMRRLAEEMHKEVT